MSARRWLWGAGWGAVVWLGINGAWDGPASPTALLMLSVWVLVPLVAHRADGLPDWMIWPWAAAAGVLSMGLFWTPGPVAAGLALPWLGFTGLGAVLALRRIRARGLGAWGAQVADLAWVYVPVGAMWLVASRLGIRPMGFSDVIVLLTAVHFHHASFTVLAITGATGRRLGTRRPTWRVGAFGATVGPWLVAAGISIAPAVEVLATTVLAVGLAAVDVLLLRLAWRHKGVAGLCLGAAALANLGAMGLALVYALGLATGQHWLNIGQMVPTHGMLNALGFGLLGLLGLALLAPPHPSSARGPRQGPQTAPPADTAM